MSLLVKPVQDKIRKRCIPLHCLLTLIVQDKKNTQNTVEGTISCKQAAINIFVLKCTLSSLCPIAEHGHASPFGLVTHPCLEVLVDTFLISKLIWVVLSPEFFLNSYLRQKLQQTLMNIFDSAGLTHGILVFYVCHLCLSKSLEKLCQSCIKSE